MQLHLLMHTHTHMHTHVRTSAARSSVRSVEEVESVSRLEESKASWMEVEETSGTEACHRWRKADHSRV